MYVSPQTADVLDRAISQFVNSYLITTNGEILTNDLKSVLNHGFTNYEIATGVLKNFVPNLSNKKYFCWMDGNEFNCEHSNLMWVSKPTCGPIITKVFGPYLRKDGRKHLIITYYEEQSGAIVSKRTISFPKYLKELELGSPLYHPLTVDHQDNDFTNDDLSNLKVMVLSEHVKQDAIRRNPVYSKCVQCGKHFELTRDQIHGQKRKHVRSGPFCSKSCRGSFSREVQLKRRSPAKIKLDETSYSRNK